MSSTSRDGTLQVELMQLSVQKHNVVFRDPNTAEGQTEPWINEKQE